MVAGMRNDIQSVFKGLRVGNFDDIFGEKKIRINNQLKNIQIRKNVQVSSSRVFFFFFYVFAINVYNKPFRAEQLYARFVFVESNFRLEYPQKNFIRVVAC